MTNEWTDLPTLVSVCNAQTDGWEIEYGIGEDWRKWDGGDWRGYWKFRARPRQPKMKEVKMLCWLSRGLYLDWCTEGNDPTVSGIRQPHLDMVAKVPE